MGLFKIKFVWISWKMTNTKIFHAGRRAVVGYEDGTVRIWDLKQGNSLHVLKGTKYCVEETFSSLEHNTCILVISPLLKKIGSFAHFCRFRFACKVG